MDCLIVLRISENQKLVQNKNFEEYVGGNLGQNYIILNKISTQTLKIHSEMQGNSRNCDQKVFELIGKENCSDKKSTISKEPKISLPVLYVCQAMYKRLI